MQSSSPTLPLLSSSKPDDSKGKQKEVSKPNAGGSSCTGTGIVNGVVVKTSDLVARATVRLAASDGSTFCTGTLIGPQQILTAGHCMLIDNVSVPKESIQVGFGINGTIDPGIKVSGITVTPAWQGYGTSGNYPLPGVGEQDLAVLTFTGTLPNTAIPAQITAKSNVKAGDILTVAGFGARSDADAVDHKTLYMYDSTIAEGLLAAKEFRTAPTGGGDCYGDSGGPFYVKNATTQCLDLAGVVSRGVSNSCATGEGYHTDVRAHLDWIKQAFSALGQPLPQ